LWRDGIEKRILRNHHYRLYTLSPTNNIADDNDPSAGQRPRTKELVKNVTDEGTTSSSSSKREMLAFAIPALGIYLCNPLLSNIDNAFVGRTVGTAGLAALAPATTCTDQMLYLFSFLGRATTSIVARSYGRGGKNEARESASARKYLHTEL
jgi:Na+-driven multidrug efflux pump